MNKTSLQIGRRVNGKIKEMLSISVKRKAKRRQQ